MAETDEIDKLIPAPGTPGGAGFPEYMSQAPPQALTEGNITDMSGPAGGNTGAAPNLVPQFFAPSQKELISQNNAFGISPELTPSHAPAGPTPEMVIPPLFTNIPTGRAGEVSAGGTGMFSKEVVENLMAGINRQPDLLKNISPLVDDYAQRFQMYMREANTGNPLADMKIAANRLGMVPHAAGIWNAGTGAQKAPSDIAKNISEAMRPQIVPNAYTGEPGQMSSFMVPPGGSPQTFAKGSTEGGKGGPGAASDAMMTALIPKISERALEAAFDFTQPPEKQQQAMGMFLKLMNFAENYQSRRNNPAPKPDWATYYRTAKKMNPEATDDEIRGKYTSRYGGNR